MSFYNWYILQTEFELAYLQYIRVKFGYLPNVYVRGKKIFFGCIDDTSDISAFHICIYTALHCFIY